MAKRGACSDLVYHMAVMSIREGDIVASNMARKIRVINMPVTFVTKAVKKVVIPHPNIQNDNHLDAGNLCIQYAKGCQHVVYIR
jgi:hypothetical protein